VQANKIPPVDLSRQYRSIEREIAIAVQNILSSGLYIGGKSVSDFEAQFANYHEVNHCVTCNSGTDALYLALLALGIGKGDEVITTPFTFIATAEIISRAGATPVFVDIDFRTFNLDLDLLPAAITDKTKAIVPVHLFGNPSDMTRLSEIARQHNLYLIEDCAQATGAEWNDRKVGSIGDIGCFSFFPTKNLGSCGDGGAITTNNAELAAQIRTIKEHGSRERYIHETIGLNSRLDSLQAAILQVKLPYLDRWNQQRTEIAERYHQLLKPIIRFALPQALQGGKSVWNQYTISIENKLENREDCNETSRDMLRRQLQSNGIASMVYYPLCLHLQPVYRHLGYKRGDLPVSEKAATEVLSLPMFPDLTAIEQETIAYAIKDCLESLA
jgi:dTDP-4-amino-4,6-dideoxygalactose transaminase